MVTTPPQESLFETAKPEETLALLQGGVTRASRLQCWTTGQKHSHTSRIVKVNDVHGIISISISKENPGAEAFQTALLKGSVEEVFFSLHLPTDVIFFKGSFRRGDAEFLNVRVNIPIFKTQRRHSMRLPVSASENAISLRLVTGKSVDVEMLNFSDGGVGLAIRKKSDYDLLVAVKTPITLSFKVMGLAVTALALVRHGFEVGAPGAIKSYRIGMQFAVIDTKLRERLSQIVFEESSKFIGRY